MTGRTFENSLSQKGNSVPPAAAPHLTDEFGKIGHTHQKRALPSEQLENYSLSIPSSLTGFIRRGLFKVRDPSVVLFNQQGGGML